MWLGHLGPGVIRGRLRLVSPFVYSSASRSSCPDVLQFCRCLLLLMYVLFLSGLCFDVSLSVFVLALSLSLSLSSLCLLFACLALTCLVLWFLVLVLSLSCSVLSCAGLCPCLALVLSSLVLVLSCLVCSLCRLGGLVGSSLVVLGVFWRHFWSSWGSF